MKEKREVNFEAIKLGGTLIGSLYRSGLKLNHEQIQIVMKYIKLAWTQGDKNGWWTEQDANLEWRHKKNLGIKNEQD